MSDDHERGDTGRCGRCAELIPTDAEECPVCGYRPASHHPPALRLGQYAFAAVFVGSLLVFGVGVASTVLEWHVDRLATLAIITPYTTGISGFFAYYLYRKRQATPTDDDVFE